MNDHEIRQKRWAEFERQPYEESKGQEHPEAPEEVSAVEDGGQEHMLRGEEEGGDKPYEPAIDLFGEARHAIAKIGGQFREPDREREDQTQHECPSWQRLKEHVRGNHRITKDRPGERFAGCADNGHGNDAEKDKPKQVYFPGFTQESQNIPETLPLCIEYVDKQIKGNEVGKSYKDRPVFCGFIPCGFCACGVEDQCDQCLKEQE